MTVRLRLSRAADAEGTATHSRMPRDPLQRLFSSMQSSVVANSEAACAMIVATFVADTPQNWRSHAHAQRHHACKRHHVERTAERSHFDDDRTAT